MRDITSEFLGARMPAHDVFDELAAHPDIRAKLAEQGKLMEGGFVSVAGQNGSIYVKMQIYSCPDDSVEARQKFSEEKAYRLSRPWHASHVLSRQSEDKAREQYPGAIRTDMFILSFSGLPGHLDELYMLALAVRIEWMTGQRAREILVQFPNDYATPQVIADFFPL